MRLHVIAPSSAATTALCVSTSGLTMSLPMVSATAVPVSAPASSNTAATKTACFGV
jgi:hypothetical protein